MAIVAGVREDDVGAELACKLFERILYLCELGGEVPIPECMYSDGLGGRGTQETSRSTIGLDLTLARSAPYHPAKVGSGPPCCQREQRCATADLNVIGVSAQAQHTK